MKLSLINVATVLILSLVIFECHATPLGNHWSASDPRCGGGNFPGIRLRRSVTTNNFNEDSYHYKFNPNHGRCEIIFGGSGADYQAFSSRSECERNCMDVYHFA